MSLNWEVTNRPLFKSLRSDTRTPNPLVEALIKTVETSEAIKVTLPDINEEANDKAMAKTMANLRAALRRRDLRLRSRRETSNTAYVWASPAQMAEIEPENADSTTAQTTEW